MIKYLTLFLILVFTSLNTYSADLNIEWTTPTERENGVALDPGEIAGYDICVTYDTLSGECEITKTVEGNITSTVIQGALPDNSTPVYVKMRTIDTGDRVSKWSDTVQKILITNPLPPIIK